MHFGRNQYVQQEKKKKKKKISLSPTLYSTSSHHAHFQTIYNGKSTALNFPNIAYWYRFVDHINF